MLPPVVAALAFFVGQSTPPPAHAVPAKQVLSIKPSYAAEAAVVQQSDTTFQYNGDGTGAEEVHVRVKVQNDAGVRQFAVLTATYASHTQTAQVENITVTHADGTTTVTPLSDAMMLPAQVTQEAPLYSDIQLLQIPVRGLRPGDALDYRMKIAQTSAEAPNQFWNSATFITTEVCLSQTVTLDVPTDKYVQVWNSSVQPVVTKSGGRTVYRWTTSQLNPTSDKDKKPAPSPDGEKPDVAWTTFHSWQEIGDWYRSLAAPQAVPSDAGRAQADSLTQGITAPEDQVKAIYTFVSTHIRYIGIDFGIGRYQPHPAAEVLANQYGDCKDKDTLLEALLHAKGFTTAPALVGVGVATISELPSPGEFNHVITTVQLPSGQIWLDSTPEVAPYRLLISQIRDKQVLVIPASGDAALRKTPADPPFPFVNRFVADGALKSDGELDAHVDITDRSDSELLLRELARNAAPAQWDQVTQDLANMMGFGGTVSHSNFSHPDDLTLPAQLSYDYTRKNYGDFDNYRTLPILPVVFLPGAPDQKPNQDLDLGSPRTEIATSQMQLPPDFIANLPNPVHVKTPFATYDETYSFEHGKLTVNRTVVVLQEKVPPSNWEAYKKFVNDASFENVDYITLTHIGPAKPSQPATASTSGSNSNAADLIEQVVALERNRDWAGALSKLDQARAIQPAQPFLWSNYGFIAMRQGRLEEAEKDFAKELQLHPDESYVALLDAGVLKMRHKDTEASTVLSAAFDRDRTNKRVALMLAAIEAKTSLNDAISTLEIAGGGFPKDPDLATALASFELQNHQAADAQATITRVLPDAATPEALNDESYILAETGKDLPLAEQKTRQGLQLLDQRSQVDIGSANEQSFQQAYLLVATWDTLGYILLQENKLDEAREYLAAAWRNRPDTSVGVHYGQVLEKLGQKKEALRIDQLSWKENVSQNQTGDQQQLREAILTLKSQGYRTSIGDPAIDLQNARTFHFVLRSPYSSFASATFRLQLQAGGVRNLLRVSGDASLEQEGDAIRKLALPPLVPAHSGAYLLRDAVVTCSPGQRQCELVLIPLTPISVEQAGN